jgi:hypothetical protein
MSSLVGSAFTAATATLQFFGRQVGELQSLNWNENSNYKRVAGIGNGIDSIHVPGLSQYDLTARRALLEADLVLDLITVMKTGQFTGKTPFAGVIPNAASNSFRDASITNTDLMNALINGSGTIELGDKIVNIYFDILIQNSAGQTLFTFEDCSLNTRRASMDVNGVIVMSDVSFLARKKRLNTNTDRAPELKI